MSYYRAKLRINNDSAVEKIEEAAELKRPNETMTYALSLRQLLNGIWDSAASDSTSFGQKIKSIVANPADGNTISPAKPDS